MTKTAIRAPHHRELGYAEIIFHVGGMEQLPSPFLMGLLNQPVTLDIRGRLDIIGIRCYPWGVFDLLGLPAATARVHILDHPISALHATLKQCIDTGRIDGALHHVECHFMRTHMTMDGMLARAGAAMREANGLLTVSDVAAAAHASVRTLERKFKQSSGHTVKAVCGLMRVEQVRNTLFHCPHVNIAGLAHAQGYVDQSQLSREFKRYTGTTPAAFARRQPRGDFGGFVQA